MYICIHIYTHRHAKIVLGHSFVSLIISFVLKSNYTFLKCFLNSKKELHLSETIRRKIIIQGTLMSNWMAVQKLSQINYSKHFIVPALEKLSRTIQALKHQEVPSSTAVFIPLSGGQFKEMEFFILFWKTFLKKGALITVNGNQNRTCS